MPTTGGRSHGRQGVRPHPQGAAAEHLPKIVTCLATLLVVVAFVLVMTPAGHDIDAATQRFMLFYAGVFALLGLTGSVLVGLIATDRVFLTPGHRVMAQAVHRAFSFGALAFLVIHIVTEILAQRVHVIDAFIPFLSPFRTFYIGLGTIASDLMLLIVVSSILRKRFTAHGGAWRWRAIHYSAYAAFVLGVLHGLLGGRTAKPYVDWSYGFAIALTALGLVVRFLAASLRSRESLSAPPGAERAGAASSAARRSSSLHAAAMSMAQAQLGATIQVLPGGGGLPGTGPRTALPPAQGWSSASGPLPALGAAPAYPGEAAFAGEAAYANLGYVPLGAPPYGDGVPATGFGGEPGPGPAARQPLYEPGYDGPPRFVGAPRGQLPQDDVSSYPYGAREHPGGRPYGDGGRHRTGAHRSLGPYGPSQADASRADRNTGPMPRALGPAPRADSGPMPRADSGPMPRLGSGPRPRADSGPIPRLGTGPASRADSGPASRADSGPVPRADSGPVPRAGTGPLPRADSGPLPRADSGPVPRAGTGPLPRLGSGSASRADSGRMPRLGTGPVPRADSGPMPRLGAGPAPRGGTGPMPRPGSGPPPGAGSRSGPDTGTGPMPRAATGPLPRVDAAPAGFPGPLPRANPAGRPDVPANGPSTRPMPRGATRPSRRPDSADPRHRKPRPDRSDEWE